MNSIDPIDDEVQNAFGLAVEVFPRVLPKAFNTLRKDSEEGNCSLSAS